MSTCPDSDLFSAYVDGEVPSPWKEKLEAHASSCPECAKRTERYKTQQNLIRQNQPTLTETRLVESFSRLCAKRNVLVVAMAHTHQQQPLYLAWTQKAVRIPVSALAAVLLLAVFFPSYFLLTKKEPVHANQQSLTILPGESTMNTNISQKMKALSTSTPVYSPDLLTYTSTKSLLAANRNQLFTIISFASKFSSAKDLFSDGDIIIIKLPGLTHFDNTGEELFSTDNNLQQAVGF